MILVVNTIRLPQTSISSTVSLKCKKTEKKRKIFLSIFAEKFLALQVKSFQHFKIFYLIYTVKSESESTVSVADTLPYPLNH